MNVKAVAHRLVLLIVHLQEEHIWVLLRKLANLHTDKKVSEPPFNSKTERQELPLYLYTSTSILPWGEGPGSHRSQGKRSRRRQACRRRWPTSRPGLGRTRPPACWAEAPSPTTLWLSQTQGSSAENNPAKHISTTQ